MNESKGMIVKSTAAAALLDSMHVVRQALMKPAGISPEQLSQRIHEWQLAMVELIGGTVKGAELNTLYEIIGVLNSSLDLNKTLGLVMDSLIHLTGAERGCLMLLNDRGELEIEAAQNFDRASLDSFDLELSHTVVREAIEKGHPVLTTNAQVDPRFSGQESVVGYQLRSVVCVPLHVRERVTGALYLDNRMREGVFSQEDLPILTAFASQAAVAIENARLYTLTDRALAARVDELSTLQLIGRELNSSLELERVLNLTLAWALRITGAQRGTLSLLNERGEIEQVCRAGGEEMPEPETAVVEAASKSAEAGLIAGTRLLVPIRYEGRTIGLLDLRSQPDAAFSQERVEFAGRLADHAAVAIENAYLYEQVRQANRAKSDLVAYIAHKLSTPLTSIRGYAEMFEKGMAGSLTPEQMTFFRTVTRNTERMQRLVSKLQDISQIESDQMRLNLKPTALAEVVERAVQATRENREAQEQQVTVDVPADIPPVQADAARLEQVLADLLDNASRYNRPGGHIQVRAWAENGNVYCAVSDDGIGISDEDQEKLFTKYFRSRNPLVREKFGAGLGLCIAKGLLELHRGKIEVESQADVGTKVTVALPAAQPHADLGDKNG